LNSNNRCVLSCDRPQTFILFLDSNFLQFFKTETCSNFIFLVFPLHYYIITLYYSLIASNHTYVLCLKFLIDIWYYASNIFNIRFSSKNNVAIAFASAVDSYIDKCYDDDARLKIAPWNISFTWYTCVKIRKFKIYQLSIFKMRKNYSIKV